MGRASSPALSENEFDISNKLFDSHDLDSDGASVEGDASGNGASGRIANDDSEEDDAFIAATQAAVNRQNDGKASKKAGAFKTMGLNANLLKAIARKGFSVPTPIQRKTIPLILDGQDVVGMARTGSGKTAAFVIPMIEKLKSHSAKVGARAVVLSPSRELALQTLKVVKEMGKGTDLRITLLVGGDSLEEQFSSMVSNPDIVIATPGRFEHLKVEMGLQLSSVRYVVFDEADRLFEMGFAAQLTEIMHSMPTSRQTLLFSATLPKSLVEFARAGLQEPKLVRLDAETKIAPGLESAFFTIKNGEKEGALLNILQDIIHMPVGETEAATKAKAEENNLSKKRKRGGDRPGATFGPSKHSTIIFTSTKHHVEYLAHFLKLFGYATSYVYGSLDQTARKMQVHDFKTGLTNILVVTDVAARGLDIPVLANVINYGFPSQPKIFVHRVGRTARAGKQGWAYSLVTGHDMPYLLDLQLFLGRKFILGRGNKEPELFKNAIVVGSLVRSELERSMEEAAKLIDDDTDLTAMREVAGKGEGQYLRTRNAASAESVKRAKELSQSDASRETNLLLAEDVDADMEQRRLDMLARVSGFRPQETVFEIGNRGAANDAADIMKKRRSQIEKNACRKASAAKDDTDDEADVTETGPSNMPEASDDSDDEELMISRPAGIDMDETSDNELELAFSRPAAKRQNRSKASWQDSEHFMSYNPSSINMAEDRGYGVHSGGVNSNFVEAARGATMDLVNDETKAFGEPSRSGGLRWDKKSKKYVARANDEDGSKGAKMIRGESGLKIAASFRSGRFDAWRKANRVSRLPKVGEMERPGVHYGNGPGGMGKRYKHKQERAPKDADKYRDDYHTQKKKVAEAKEKRVGRFADGPGRPKNELKGVDDVRKGRKLKERRRDKNARPSRKK